MATEWTVFDYVITVPAQVGASGASLLIIAGGKQGYSNTDGSKPWTLRIYFDGTELTETGGAGAVTDSPSLFSVLTGVAAGDHHVKLTWSGDPSIQFSRAVMGVLAAAK